jgi:Ca2+-binding RTX toxin-like protein
MNGLGKVLNGDAGDDSLFGLSGGATLNGGDGDDGIVLRFAGALSGGAGDDIVIGADVQNPSPTTLTCGPGIDRAEADLADEIAADCENVIVHIQGTIGDDVIDGTPYTDYMDDGEGNDVLNGLGGGDSINSREGMDTVHAGDGDDFVFTNWGSHFQIVGDVDTVTCGDGNDTAYVDDVDTVAADCETVFVGVAPKG